MSSVPLSPREVWQKISEGTLVHLLGYYPVSVSHAAFFPLYGGLRNAVFYVKTSDGEYTLTIHKPDPTDEERVRKAISIMSFLVQHDFPVPQVVRTQDGREYFSEEILGAKRVVSLHHFIRGRKVFPYGKNHLWEAGRMLSRLHETLHAFPEKDFLQDISAGQEFSGEKTVLHLDFARGNILFDRGGKITAILDFEDAALGFPVVDISKSLAIHYKDRKDLATAEIKEAFLTGYRSGSLKLLNEAEIPALVEKFSKEII